MSEPQPVVVIAGAVGNVLAVLLGVAALAAYFAGARHGRRWGGPLLVVCVVGAVLCLAVGRLRGPSGAEVARRRAQEQSMQRARLCGEGLADRLSKGARVVVLRPVLEGEDPMDPPMDSLPPLAERQEETCARIGDALEDGLGASIELVGCEPVMSSQLGPDKLDAGEFATILDRYRDRTPDAWISLVGLPPVAMGGLRGVGTHRWSRPPAVAADVDIFYEPRVLRDWFEQGLLDAVVLLPPTGEKGAVVVTGAERLPATGFAQ